MELKDFKEMLMGILSLFVLVIICSAGVGLAVLSDINSDPCSDGIYSNYSKDFVRGGDGFLIILANNENATDPTFNELMDFISFDGVDGIAHIKNGFVSTDYAELVHNNAERKNIKAAYILVNDGVSPEYALNGFNIVDYGFVYIDCVGHHREDKSFGVPMDKFVTLEVGKIPEYEFIFTMNTIESPLEEIVSMEVIW